MMTEKDNTDLDRPVDAVILWVDGSDQQLTAKRNIYLAESGRSGYHGTEPTFYASANEIRYCVLSILKFAPFIRNIFIVTDDQDPHLYGEIKKHFPSRSDALRIVDHKEIFRGYEKYLPTFNSTAIESMIWRIEGLSDNFIYFNDDIFLIRETTHDDWFINNRPVLRGEWHLPPYRRYFDIFLNNLIYKTLLRDRSYRPRLSFYLRQWNAARLAGMRFRYFFHCHTPHALNRKTIEDFYSSNPGLLEKNIAERFRTPEQYIMISMANHLEIKSGNTNFAKLDLGYFHPYYSKVKITRRMRKCKRKMKVRYVCAQNLDMFLPGEREMMFRWMDEVLDL